MRVAADLSRGLWIDAPDALERVRQLQCLGQADDRTAQALSSLVTNGFAVLRAAVPAPLLQAAWGELDRALAQCVSLDCHREGLGSFASTEAAARGLADGRYAVHDVHERSFACQAVVSHPAFTALLQLLFDGTPVLMQSQMFRFGSDKGTHTDFTHCPVARPLQTATVWIAADAVDACNGPLYVFPRSHRLPLHRFGDGSLMWPHGEDLRQLDLYHRSLQAQCVAAGLQPWTFEAAPGDLLLMHPRLAHGAWQPTAPGRSRRSFALHAAAPAAYVADHRTGPGGSTLRSIGGLRYWHRQDRDPVA